MQGVSNVKQQSAARFVLLLPAATACTGLILCSVFNSRAQKASQELIGLLNGGTIEFRHLCILTTSCLWGASTLCLAALLGIGCVLQKSTSKRMTSLKPCKIDQQISGPTTAALCATLGLAVICALAMLASSSMLTAVNHTLGVGLHRATVVYTNAEAALAEGQLELENGLKPPKDLQDVLYKAKASLPPPPDPIQQLLGGFADAALGGLFQPATDAVQKAVKDNVDKGAADLTKDNAALAALLGQVEGLLGQQSAGGICPESCLDLGKYPVLHSSACVCAHQALSHMHDLALHARYQGVVAITGASMLVVGLVWLLAHLAFWLGGMHARQMVVQHTPSMEQLPLKSAPMAIARDDSDDSLILSEVEMAAAPALDHDFRAGPPKEPC